MVRNVKFLAKKSKTNTVNPLAWDLFEVTSGSSGKVYTIRGIGNLYTCTCDWHKYHSLGECSHVLAVREYIAKNVEDRRIKLYADLETAKKAHRRIEILNDGLVVSSRSK